MHAKQTLQLRYSPVSSVQLFVLCNFLIILESSLLVAENFLSSGVVLCLNYFPRLSPNSSCNK